MRNDQRFLQVALTWLLAATALVYSAYMSILDGRRLLIVLQGADPTGLQGLSFYAFGILSNIVVVFLFLTVLLRGIKKPVPVLYTVIFSLKVLEAAGALPCSLPRPGELCGLGSVLISYFTAPLTIILSAVLAVKVGRTNVRRAALVAITVIVLTGGAFAVAWWGIAPKSVADCTQIAEVSGRGVCQEKFALKQRDMETCRRIEFRPLRHECMRMLAQVTRSPESCEEIRDAPAAQIPAYETPDIQTRSLCYYSLAFEMKRRDLCLHVEDPSLGQTCLTAIRSETGK